MERLLAQQVVLFQLHPVLDDGGLIRAKGRVFKAEALDQETRQPVILDNRHPSGKVGRAAS